MTDCPRCGSARCSSNKLIPVTDDQIRQGINVIRATNKPIIEVWAMAAWALHRAINFLRPDYRCDHCAFRFSDSES